MNEAREKLIDAVIEQMKNGMEMGDYEAIVELLNAVPEANLKGYLPELSGEDESTEGEEA